MKPTTHSNLCVVPCIYERKSGKTLREVTGAIILFHFSALEYL